MPKDKLQSVKVHVNRMGKDGAHLSISARDKKAGSFDMDLKYRDMPEHLIDQLLPIGEQFKADAEAIAFEGKADLVRYAAKCGAAITKAMYVVGREAGIDIEE